MGLDHYVALGGVVLCIDAEMGVVAPLMQHPAVTRDRWLIEAHELAAMDAKSGLAVDRLDGFAFGSATLRIIANLCLNPVFRVSKRQVVRTLIQRGFPPILKRQAGVCPDVLILPESRRILGS